MRPGVVAGQREVVAAGEPVQQLPQVTGAKADVHRGVEEAGGAVGHPFEPGQGAPRRRHDLHEPAGSDGGARPGDEGGLLPDQPGNEVGVEVPPLRLRLEAGAVAKRIHHPPPRRGKGFTGHRGGEGRRPAECQNRGDVLALLQQEPPVDAVEGRVIGSPGTGGRAGRGDRAVPKARGVQLADPVRHRPTRDAQRPKERGRLAQGAAQLILGAQRGEALGGAAPVEGVPVAEEDLPVERNRGVRRPGPLMAPGGEVEELPGHELGWMLPRDALHARRRLVEPAFAVVVPLPVPLGEERVVAVREPLRQPERFAPHVERLGDEVLAPDAGEGAE